MLTFLDKKGKDANVELLALMDNVYILKAEWNRISLLNVGSKIWVDMGDYYNVYSLNAKLPSSNETELKNSAEQIINVLKTL